MTKNYNNSNSKAASRIFGRAGFTLAEVLITLAIVGVVAAITMPNLIANHKKKTYVNKLQKAYITLNQAFKLSEVENGSSDFWDDAFELGNQAYFEKYWEPYFNNATLCETYEECGYDKIKPYKFLNGEIANIYLQPSKNVVKFYLPDGTLYTIIVSILNAETGEIVPNTGVRVDVNGPKGPNQLGRDVFYLARRHGVGILPYGHSLTKEQTENNCLDMSIKQPGMTCAKKIMMDGWEMNY